MKEHKSTGNPKAGMQRNNSVHLLDENAYIMMLNGNNESQDGERLNLTAEPSNLLAVQFSSGYKAIGVENDLLSGRTYYILTNPQTGFSSIGYVSEAGQEVTGADTPIDCADCGHANQLAPPLENQVQTPSATYIEIISDAACEGNLNLSIDYPVKTIEIKNEHLGTTMYFEDDRNPPRYIQLDNLLQYTQQDEPCTDDTTPVCLDVDRMRVFPLYTIPHIEPGVIQLGGNLKLGIYEVMVAYCDTVGNEISEYYSNTQPVSIFDENNRILNQTELDSRTNYAIKFSVSNLDPRFPYYKVVVMQRTDVAQTQSYFIEGIHPTTDNSVLYTSENNKQRTTLDHILTIKQRYSKAKGLMQSNGYLFHYGVTEKRKINLQPVVNLFSQFLKWQTNIAKEDLYKDGIATSKFRSYNRDETYAFGIRTIHNDGEVSKIFPFVGRQPTAQDLTEVDTDSQDRLSIEANLNSCQTTGRTQRWQFYNDATEDNITCGDSDIPTSEVTEEIFKTCTVDNVQTLPPATFSIETGEPFTTLEDFIQQAIEDGTCQPITDCASPVADPYPFCEYLEVSCYSDQNCDVDFTGCTDITVDSEQLIVDSITGDGPDGGAIITKIEKTFVDDYGRIKPPAACGLYVVSGGNDPQRDRDFEISFGQCILPEMAHETIYERNYSFSNNTCGSADELQNVPDTSTASFPYFHNYYGGVTQADLQTTKDTTAFTTGWTDKVHKGALWFKGVRGGRNVVILEISKQLNPSGGDDVSDGQVIRMSLFKNCSASAALYSELVTMTAGSIYRLEVIGTNLWITNGAGSTTDLGAYSGDNFFVALDNKIIPRTNCDGDDVFRTAPTDGCFSIVTRDAEYARIDISYTSIVLNKKQIYKAECTYEVPIVQSCKALPYRQGEFGYHQSTDTYPDNGELYNSSALKIKPSDVASMTSAQRTRFISDFTNGTDTDGNYIWKTDGDEKPLIDLRCRPIRHFRMPDNKVAPFMWAQSMAPFASTVIFPLAVTIDETQINIFFDIAVKNGLISQEERDSITGYEIVRGDRTGNKSVIASGYLYDMRTYRDETNRSILYPNYPYNDLGSDKLNLEEIESSEGPIAHDAESNYNFTFHSPETDFEKITTPSEMKVEGYGFGKSRGNFVAVKDHPKWVILGKKAKRTATQLAALEVSSELAIAASQSSDVYQLGFGVVETANVAGIVIAVIAGITGLLSSVVDLGKYRYEWLQIFRNLGSPRNYAYYYTSEGYYNYLQALQQEGNMVRGINVGKNLKEGYFRTVNELTGEKLEINNEKRERSMFVSLGQDFPLVWDEAYSTFDNNEEDTSTSSLTYASEVGNCRDGRSVDLYRNIASPYVKLKNYIENQYGTIGSISWLSTGYRGDLTNPQGTCISIFGGDTFISRYALKRKMPIFREDAMNVASLTPYNYKEHNTIGTRPRFFCNYEIGGENSIDAVVFPDIDTEYGFDCLVGAQGLYVKPPSKFYLYYYGVPQLLCETEINTNYRYGGVEPENNFYPNVGDLIDWTQETNVSIKQPNSFRYNTVYSRPVTRTAFDVQLWQDTYKSVDEEIKRHGENRVIYSLPDNNEDSRFDPWLIYRALDTYEFPKKYGRLIHMKDLESATILGRFENQQVVFNAIDNLADKITNVSIEVGTGGIFAKRPLEFKATDLGYAGTQHTDMASTPFGHFTVDAARGKIFMLDNTGRDLVPISDTNGKEESGLKNWFREHLPFKILKSLPFIDIDNKFKGIGMSIGWDARFERVFFTKRDYVLRPGINKNNFTFSDNRLLYNDVEVQFSNTTFFEDVSWTIAYKVGDGSWVSYYSFAPDYYVPQNNYFQTGYNGSGNIWNHLLTNRSFGVFQGVKYPFAIEVPIKNEQVNKMLTTISTEIEAKRWNNAWDFSQNKNIGFNRAAIWNNTDNSGTLNLVQGKALSQISAYPKTNADNTQDILWTSQDGRQTFNYFYNRVLNQDSGVPQWIWDKNMIEKQIDSRAVGFRGKTVLERLRGQFFTLRLEYDMDSRYQMTLKDFTSTSQIY